MRTEISQHFMHQFCIPAPPSQPYLRLTYPCLLYRIDGPAFFAGLVHTSMFLYRYFWLSVIVSHLSNLVTALDADGWRKQTIYQVLVLPRLFIP